MTNMSCQTPLQLTKWQTITQFEHSLTRARGSVGKGPKSRKRPKGKKKYPLGPF